MQMLSFFHQASVDPGTNAYAIEIDAADPGALSLLLAPPGSRMEPTVIWTRRFDTMVDRDAVLDAIHSGAVDLQFLGRLTMIFGDIELGKVVGGIIIAATDARRQAADEAADTARKHQLVNLFTCDTKRGYVLELQRKSRDAADWKTVYDRASERDRLCDWLRWQKPRFLDFLDYAARNGDEGLTRLLTDEMFETERSVKKQGRGAGGVRPLRMWRGE